MRHVHAPILSALLVVTLAGCGLFDAEEGSRPTQPEQDEESGRSALIVAGGDGQVAPTGKELPRALEVRVRGPEGAAARRAVRWSVVRGRATLSRARTPVEDDGAARVVVRLGDRPGPVRVRAELAGGPDTGVVFALHAEGAP